MPAPRIGTFRSKQTPRARKYHQWRNDFAAIAKAKGFKLKQEDVLSIGFVFFVPMPKSWSKRKKIEMNKTPHQSRPDLDNFVKATIDGLFIDGDHKISEFHRVAKYWGYKGEVRVSVMTPAP